MVRRLAAVAPLCGISWEVDSMPYTKKQVRVAEAVAHGFKPTGSAKGFNKGFAKDLLVETNYGKDKSMIRKKKKTAK